MLCNTCKVEMKPGKAMIPIMGSYTATQLERGTTVYAINSVYADCMKCPKCGHSTGLWLEKTNNH